MPGELSQQQVLVKSKILNPEQMMHIDKEFERQRYKIEKDKVIIEQKILPMVEDYEESLSSSSMSMCIALILVKKV